MGTKEEKVLPIRKLGRTGLETSQLGFGTAVRAVSDGGPDDDHAGCILNTVLDAGINFIDTAPDYGNSEELIGQYMSHRRDQFYLATKCGCNIGRDGNRLHRDHLWTADRLIQNIDHSLKRMRTDYVGFSNYTILLWRKSGRQNWHLFSSRSAKLGKLDL